MFDSMFWFWPFAAIFTGAFFLVGILVFAFWVWMIVDCARRKFNQDIEKIVWILVIVLASWIGALIYLLVVKLSNDKGLMKARNDKK